MVFNECSQECRVRAFRLHRVDHVIEIFDVSLHGAERFEKGEVTEIEGLVRCLGFRVTRLDASYIG